MLFAGGAKPEALEEEPTILTPAMVALEARKRTLHNVTSATARVLHNLPPGDLFCRVPTLWEEVDARVWAARYARAEVGEAVAMEESAMMDLATMHVVAYAFRRRSGETDEPAFGPPKWLSRRLKSDELAGLLNILNECRARESGHERLSQDAALDIIAALADSDEQEAADLVPHLSRTQLVELLRLAANAAAQSPDPSP